MQSYTGERFYMKNAAKEIPREAGAATRRAQNNLKRATRHLADHPRLLIMFYRQKPGNRHRVFVDGDHAGCRQTRESTTGLAAMCGMHTLSDSSTTQPPLSTSSGGS